MWRNNPGSRILPLTPRPAVLLSGLLLLFLASISESFAQQPQAVATGSTGTRSLTQEERSRAIAELPPEHLKWLRNVAGLMTNVELDYFLSLRENFRREAFMEEFWRPRDPDPRTTKNELKERWQQYVRNSAQQGGGLPFADPRFLMVLLSGSPGNWTLPDSRTVGRCFSRSRELEIWFYGRNPDLPQGLVVIFFQRTVDSPYEIYRLGDLVRPVRRAGSLPTTDIRLLCADELLRYAINEANGISKYEALLEKAITPPTPSSEWIANLAAAGTDLPPDVDTFEVITEVTFPARKQSRTAMEVLLRVPREAAPGRDFDGVTSHHFLLVGEVIRDGRRFEDFRYRFEGPTPEGILEIPLGFTRYLRPGEASLRLLLEDINSGHFARVVQDLQVPSPEGLAAVAVDKIEPPKRPELRLSLPTNQVYVGKMRFTARANQEFDKVTFLLDDRPILSKRRPPYSVELDLGDNPEPHRVRVIGLINDQEVATDQVWLNQGALRFQVHLVEPRPGGIYPGSFTARVEVQTPDGTPPQRLELFLGNEKVATLTDPPFSQSLRLADQQATVVRAVAFLADGSTTEDAVIVNGAPFIEEIEVRTVEIPTWVVDSAGNPLDPPLTREQFRLFEEGRPVPIQDFVGPGESPLQVALLIDRSASMAPLLPQVSAAAAEFARTAVRSQEDRIALLTFAQETSVDVPLTATSAAIEQALPGLRAFGETAFYDSLVQALNTFDNNTGYPAMLVFTDGLDDASRLTFEQTLATVQRRGIVLYIVGLDTAFEEKELRRQVDRLATETGGQAHFLTDLEQLPQTYARIANELHSRYLLTYTPSENLDDADTARELRVEVEQKGAQVRARRSFVP